MTTIKLGAVAGFFIALGVVIGAGAGDAILFLIGFAQGILGF